jgi:hypothetical protein
MIIKDALGQEVSIGDILMLSFSYTNRSLEPALLTKVGKPTRIGGADFIQIKFLIKDPDTLKIVEHIENTFTNDNSEAWIESGVKINNPEFFIHDDRISKLIAERLGIIGK